MKIHKKIWPEFYQLILEGKKNYELRLGNFECNIGDTLVLEEWNPETQKYTGRKLEREVTRVVRTKDLKFWTKEEVDKYGYQIISFD